MLGVFLKKPPSNHLKKLFTYILRFSTERIVKLVIVYSVLGRED